MPDAVLKPVFAVSKDVVSTAPHLPASIVQASQVGVQDLGSAYRAIKSSVLSPDVPVISNLDEFARRGSDVSSVSLPSLIAVPTSVGGRGGADTAAAGRGARESTGSCAVGNSFVAGTRVVMADGSSRPIEVVRLGDEVLATDPTTGESGPRRVTALIVGDGVKDLVEIDIISRDDGSAVGSVVATDGHPFWTANLDRWVDAGDLEPGHEFETADHRPAEVGATRTWTQVRRVYNLTVDELHTYHVEAGLTPVLVHNCNTTVVRWMSEDEYRGMSDTGKVQAGSGGTSTFVANPANSDAYRKQAKAGSIYAEFDVPCSCLKPASDPGWAQIPGPTHPIYGKLNAKRGLPLPEMPSFKNLRIVDRK